MSEQTQTYYIIQSRERSLPDIEPNWKPVEDVPASLTPDWTGGLLPHKSRFATVEDALKGITFSKQFRAYIRPLNPDEPRTPLEIVESTWEYRIVQREVATTIKSTVVNL